MEMFSPKRNPWVPLGQRWQLRPSSGQSHFTSKNGKNKRSALKNVVWFCFLLRPPAKERLQLLDVLLINKGVLEARSQVL